MSGQHARRAIWFVFLTILVPCAAISPPRAPFPFVEEGRGGWPRHRQGIDGLWSLAYGASPADAAEPALLRASLAEPGPVLVGERVTIRVELLTTTTFASAPVFELPTIPGALLMKIEDRPVLGTEQLDGDSYTVQRHELALFAMRPGVAQVPPFTVRFESPPRFGEQPVEHRLTTPALQVEAHPPPGAENLTGVIATRELQVHQTWQPPPQKASPGDAFTRIVTLTAPDVPGMVFPPLPLTKVDGLAVYAKPPVVRDRVERGDFTGERIETVTYVCERPGRYTLPALVIPWWDLKHRTMMQVTLPAVTLEVDPGPVSSADTAIHDVEASVSPWLWRVGSLVLLLAAAGAAIGFKRDMLLAAWEHRQARRHAGDARDFARLLDACRASDAKGAYNALLRWLDSTHRGPDAATIERFLASHPDAELRLHVEALQESVLGRGTAWDGVALVDALRRARRQHTPQSPTAGEGRLPALNPPRVGILLVMALFAWHGGGAVEVGTAAADPTYVGGQSCVACHPREAALWQGSDHALAMQPANNSTVLDNFDHATFEEVETCGRCHARRAQIWGSISPAIPWRRAIRRCLASASDGSSMQKTVSC